MPANTAPIFTATPAVGFGILTPSITANTRSDGNGTIATDIVKIFTADATNGSFVSKVRISPYATTASTAMTATTLRLFISNITSGATTSANTWLFQEVAMAAQTADAPTAATYFTEIPINLILPASYTILISQHVVAAANTGYHCLVFAGNY